MLLELFLKVDIFMSFLNWLHLNIESKNTQVCTLLFRHFILDANWIFKVILWHVVLKFFDISRFLLLFFWGESIRTLSHFVCFFIIAHQFFLPFFCITRFFLFDQLVPCSRGKFSKGFFSRKVFNAFLGRELHFQWS